MITTIRRRLIAWIKLQKALWQLNALEVTISSIQDDMRNCQKRLIEDQKLIGDCWQTRERLTRRVTALQDQLAILKILETKIG